MKEMRVLRDPFPKIRGIFIFAYPCLFPNHRHFCIAKQKKGKTPGYFRTEITRGILLPIRMQMGIQFSKGFDPKLDFDC